MRSRHGDVEHAAGDRQIPRRAQSRPPRGTTHPLSRELLARSGNRPHPARREIHGSQHVILGVRDVEGSVGDGQALRLVEERFLGRAIAEPGLAAADDPPHITVEASLDDAVVPGVRHEETPAGLVGQ